MGIAQVEPLIMGHEWVSVEETGGEVFAVKMKRRTALKWFSDRDVCFSMNISNIYRVSPWFEVLLPTEGWICLM
jgi:hypothetical protein